MPKSRIVTVSPITKEEFDGSVKRGAKKSTSPGPHGMMMVKKSYSKIHRFKPIKEKDRVKTLPIRKAGKAEGRQEGKTPKAKNLTRLMRKGYRKGYRVKSTRGGSRR